MGEYNSFSDFVDGLNKKEKEKELTDMLQNVPVSIPSKIKKCEIKSRLSVIDDERISTVVNIILSKANVSFVMLNDQIKKSIMYHDTALQKALPGKWEIRDFEGLYFVLFGQKEEF